MSFAAALRRWWQRRRQRRAAQATLRKLFDHPQQLAETSLRAAHRGRVDLVDTEYDGDQLVALQFTILRHPRPYAFSGQHHKVLQLYQYDVASQSVRHVRSLNVSRHEGRDGEPPGGGVL